MNEASMAGFPGRENFKLGQRCAFGRLRGLILSLQAGMFGGSDGPLKLSFAVKKEITA